MEEGEEDCEGVLRGERGVGVGVFAEECVGCVG